MITEINSAMSQIPGADDFDPGRPRGAAPVAASGVARMGAARLQDDTERDGSSLMKTIVIVAVAALTANAAGGLLCDHRGGATGQLSGERRQSILMSTQPAVSAHASAANHFGHC
jgi:hypothetical protein